MVVSLTVAGITSLLFFPALTMDAEITIKLISNMAIISFTACKLIIDYFL
jgi:hypothetical protein